MTEIARAHVALALLVAAWLLMLVAGGPGSALDEALLVKASVDALVPLAHFFTLLGSAAVLLPASLAAALLLALHRQWRSALLLTGLVLGGRLLIDLQKFAFDRARPDPEGHLVAVHNMAFPSGHAANSMMAALAIALLAVADSRHRRVAILLALLFSILVGLSRLVLQVHWPSDVIGGWMFGAAWTLALIRLAGGETRQAAERPLPSIIEDVKESHDD